MVISKEDKTLIESLKQKVMASANFLNSFRRKKMDERRFRQLDYVLILFLIVTVNDFLK